MSKWDKLRQRIHELADRRPFNTCKSHAECCESVAYKEALTDVALVMNLLEIAYPEPPIPNKETLLEAASLLDREISLARFLRWMPGMVNRQRIVVDFLRSLAGGKQ